MEIAVMTKQPCPHCKEIMEVLRFLLTGEKTAICTECGYTSILTAEVDASGKTVRTETGVKLMKLEIAQPYGVLHITTTDNLERHLPLASRDELLPVYRIVTETREIVKSAVIRRYENGKRKVIDVLRLLKNAN